MVTCAVPATNSKTVFAFNVRLYAGGTGAHFPLSRMFHSRNRASLLHVSPRCTFAVYLWRHVNAYTYARYCLPFVSNTSPSRISVRSSFSSMPLLSSVTREKSRIHPFSVGIYRTYNLCNAFAAFCLIKRGAEECIISSSTMQRYGFSPFAEIHRQTARLASDRFCKTSSR